MGFVASAVVNSWVAAATALDGRCGIDDLLRAEPVGLFQVFVGKVSHSSISLSCTLATPNQLSESIWQVLKRPAPVLFMGAGVGKRVGLPDWRSYIHLLADACDKWGDTTSGNLLREKMTRNQFLSAGTIYKACDLIPDGERWKALAAPFLATFTEKQLERLLPLVDLPFTSIVTTNYDHSIHQACVQAKKWFVPIERGDGTLRGAMFQREYLIARLHGRAEMPLTMALATEDYRALEGENEYLDFLLELFRSRTCLFIGFSFLDPAIDLVLRLYASRHGPTFQALHTALVPDGATDLATRLRALNIEVVSYAVDDDHSDLWRGIRIAHQGLAAKHGGDKVSALKTTPGLRQFIAFAYAQVQVTREERRGVAAVIQDGLVLSILAKEPEKARTVGELAVELRAILRVSEEEAKSAVAASIDKLAVKEQVLWDGDDVLLLKPPPLLLEQHLKTLSQNVVDRVRVRNGIKLPAEDLAGIQTILEEILMARAWDLGAHFAGAWAGVGSDIRHTIHELTAAQHRTRRVSAAGPIEHAILDLLRFPEDRETALLSQLGRAAFGLQMVLATPRQTLFQRFALPQRVYLDSNVLMPAITEGHPLRPVYIEALRRLETAARHVDIEMEVVVGEQFLNEVVSHRRIGSEMVEALELEDPDRLRQHVNFRTAVNTNVFVAGFAAHRLTHPTSSFEQFLGETAPYDSEPALAEYLNKHLKISTRKMFFTGEHGGTFGEVFSELLTGYESARRYGKLGGKEKLLVQHEAQQLTQLRIDMEDGLRSVFVTADEQLRRLVNRVERLHTFAGAVISQLGLVGLVDIMVGLDADSRSWAKLVWVVPQGSDEEALVEYFVRIGLGKYQEGMAAEMQEVARRVAAKAVTEAEHEKLQLFGDRTFAGSKATVKFLDRYEDEFFESWKTAIERREERK